MSCCEICHFCHDQPMKFVIAVSVISMGLALWLAEFTSVSFICMDLCSPKKARPLSQAPKLGLIFLILRDSYFKWCSFLKVVIRLVVLSVELALNAWVHHLCFAACSYLLSLAYREATQTFCRKESRHFKSVSCSKGDYRNRLSEGLNPQFGVQNP